MEGSMRFRLRALLAAASVTAALLLGAGVAGAHPVGNATEPSCHGQRVSHGASHSPVHGGHGLTPIERRDLAEEMFGEEISMHEWHQFVKMCLPPFLPG